MCVTITELQKKFLKKCLFVGANYANLLRPVTESSKIVARVPSAYIRQMADEKLLIPGRSLTLMDTIGQGICIQACCMHVVYIITPVTSVCCTHAVDVIT